MNIKQIIWVLAVVTSLVSCKREFDEIKPQTTNKAKSTSELKVATGFNWNTTNKIAFNIKGIQGDARKSTLKITDTNQNVIFQKLHEASDTYNCTIEVPAHTKTIIVSYNGVSTPYDITSGKVDSNIQ